MYIYYNNIINSNSILYRTFFQVFGTTTSLNFLQELMSLGFEYSTSYGLSLDILSTKGSLLFKHFFKSKYYTQNNYVDTSLAINNLFSKWYYLLNKYTFVNPISNILMLMIKSGAKMEWNQLSQLIGFRGFLSNIKGILQPIPVMGNLTHGLLIPEYFVSCYGTRKGLIDTSLKTADTGYLTRKLIESTVDIILKEQDCLNTNKSRKFKNVFNSGVINNKNLISYTSHKAFLCNSGRSVCYKCFGYLLNRDNSLGLPLGTIVSQSIGEPATQMTLKTFHSGGLLQKMSIVTQNISSIYFKKIVPNFKKIYKFVIPKFYSNKRKTFMLIMFNPFNAKNNLCDNNTIKVSQRSFNLLKSNKSISIYNTTFLLYHEDLFKKGTIIINNITKITSYSAILLYPLTLLCPTLITPTYKLQNIFTGEIKYNLLTFTLIPNINEEMIISFCRKQHYKICYKKYKFIDNNQGIYMSVNIFSIISIQIIQKIFILLFSNIKLDIINIFVLNNFILNIFQLKLISRNKLKYHLILISLIGKLYLL